MSISSSRATRSTSFAQYLREFASGREAWIVLGRNLIPDKLKAQVQADFFALVARAVEMQAIAHVGLGFIG